MSGKVAVGKGVWPPPAKAEGSGVAVVVGARGGGVGWGVEGGSIGVSHSRDDLNISCTFCINLHGLILIRGLIV